MVHQGLLDGVQPALGREALDSQDGLAIQLMQEQDTGIDRLVAQSLPFEPAYEHGAGPAIALGTDDLGPEEEQLLAEEFRERGEDRVPADLEAPAVHVEEDIVTHAFVCLRCRNNSSTRNRKRAAAGRHAR